jgi:hypothetical protein
MESDEAICATCEIPLGTVRYVFALQDHHVEYTLPGDTPTSQALLRPSVMTTLGRYCSSACCKKQLGAQLNRLGLPVALQNNRVMGGPICPCGRCGKPVTMTQSHAAVIKGKVLLRRDGLEDDPEWFDMLTVLCQDCQGIQALAMMALSRGRARFF